MFGESSEQRKGETAAEPKAPKKPTTGHGPKKQQNLRIVEESIELPADARVCIMCRGSLEEMGEVETSEEVDVVAREFVMKRYVRKKYRCRCGECIETAPLPPRLIPGGRYFLAFAVNVALSKYADHLPLERQVKIMRREGLEVTSQTRYAQIDALAKLLWATYDRLGVTLLDEPLLHVDETPWPVFGQKESSGKWYAWTITRTKGAYHEIHDTRGKPPQACPARLSRQDRDGRVRRLPVAREGLPRARARAVLGAHPQEVRRLRIGVSEGVEEDPRI